MIRQGCLGFNLGILARAILRLQFETVFRVIGFQCFTQIRAPGELFDGRDLSNAVSVLYECIIRVFG